MYVYLLLLPFSLRFATSSEKREEFSALADPKVASLGFEAPSTLNTHATLSSSNQLTIAMVFPKGGLVYCQASLFVQLPPCDGSIVSFYTEQLQIWPRGNHHHGIQVVLSHLISAVEDLHTK